MRRPLLALCASAFVIAGCMGSAFEPLLDMAVTTDRSSYVVGDTVRFEIRNDTDADAFLFHCGERVSFAIEERVDGAWVEYVRHGPICQTHITSGMIVLIPGSASFDEWVIDRAGTFRIRYDTGPRSLSIGTVRLHSAPFAAVGGA